MHHLAVIVHVDLVAVFLRQPLACQAQPRVDPNPLVGDLHRVVRAFVRDPQALFR